MWVIACAMVVSACTPSAEVSTTTTTVAPTTTTSSTTTTTIPISERVLESFQSYMLDEEASFRLDMEMEFEFGGLSFDATGWTLMDGSDQHSQFEMEFLGESTEVMLVGADVFARAGESVWVRTDADSVLADTPSVGLTNENTEALVESLEYVGTEDVDGTTLHRLEVGDPSLLDPNDLGLAPGTIDDAEVTMTMFADDEGVPQRWTMEITGTSPNPLTGEAADISVLATLLYTEWGEPQDIVAPSSYWESVESETMGFTGAVPSAWETSEEVSEDGLPEWYTAFNAVGDEIQVYLSGHEYDPTGGQVLSEAFRDVFEDVRETEFLPSATRVLGSSAVVWQEFEYVDEGVPVYGIHAVVPRSSLSSYELVWYSFADDYASDRERFESFITVFTQSPTELVTTDQLIPGDCVDFAFDAGEGVAVRRACTEYHDAEVILTAFVPEDEFPASQCRSMGRRLLRGSVCVSQLGGRPRWLLRRLRLARTVHG